MPGKFEGCPSWAEDFWSSGLEGMADEDDGTNFIFHVTDLDRESYPALAGIARIRLWEDGNGFVHVACTQVQ